MMTMTLRSDHGSGPMHEIITGLAALILLVWVLVLLGLTV
jgi:hypothetical protein